MATSELATRPGEPDALPVKTRYEAGFGRKFFFWAIFLLLLPFFASLPAMLFQRVTRGLWFDAAGLAVIGVAFTALMVLLVTGLLHSLRAQLLLDEKAVRLSLPARTGGLSILSYERHEVPYDQIAAVETRREIYGGTFAPVFMRGARLKTKDGRAISLGYVNEANSDSLFPVPVIAAEIARRAGVPLVDHGSVHRRVSSKILGLKSPSATSDTVSDQDIARLNKRHGSAMTVLVSALLLLLGAGIVRDLMTVNLDGGEQASRSVQEAATLTKKPITKR